MASDSIMIGEVQTAQLVSVQGMVSYSQESVRLHTIWYWKVDCLEGLEYFWKQSAWGNITQDWKLQAVGDS